MTDTAHGDDRYGCSPYGGDADPSSTVELVSTYPENGSFVQSPIARDVTVTLSSEYGVRRGSVFIAIGGLIVVDGGIIQPGITGSVAITGAEIKFSISPWGALNVPGIHVCTVSAASNICEYPSSYELSFTTESIYTVSGYEKSIVGKSKGEPVFHYRPVVKPKPTLPQSPHKVLPQKPTPPNAPHQVVAPKIYNPGPARRPIGSPNVISEPSSTVCALVEYKVVRASKFASGGLGVRGPTVTDIVTDMTPFAGRKGVPPKVLGQMQTQSSGNQNGGVGYFMISGPTYTTERANTAVFIDPSTGDLKLDSDGKESGMDPIQQRIQILTNTVEGSRECDASMGLKLPPKVSASISKEIAMSIRKALTPMVEDHTIELTKVIVFHG
jgi:hypothetical protein